MKILTMSLTATAFMLGAMAIAANAQTPVFGAKNIHAQMQKVTLFKEAACFGWGPYCPPGRVWRCGPYGRCWCAPCY
jgi:hypothetical protein